ncbi:Protein of unknown function [Gryllus bimaculatus]|nr:Protein of unknown function [Gryllus bimaculatus]
MRRTAAGGGPTVSARLTRPAERPALRRPPATPAPSHLHQPAARASSTCTRRRRADGGYSETKKHIAASNPRAPAALAHVFASASPRCSCIPVARTPCPCLPFPAHLPPPAHPALRQAAGRRQRRGCPAAALPQQPERPAQRRRRRPTRGTAAAVGVAPISPQDVKYRKNCDVYKV